MSKTVDVDRLVLGTAQLGLDYGVANTGGKPAIEDAMLLLGEAWRSGIRCFDTAQAYGDSESVLGAFLSTRADAKDANIVTKLSAEDSLDNSESLIAETKASLSRVKSQNLAGLMLHSESVLMDWGHIRRGFERLKDLGLVQAVGVSVYSPKMALEALRTEGIDMIQVPTNILDHRFRKVGFFEKAAEAGKAVYIRSIFLQGLFFATQACFAYRDDRLRYLDCNRALFWISELNKMADQVGLPLNHLALAYVRCAFPGTQILLGMENVEQVKQNIEAWSASLPGGVIEMVAERFENVEDEIVHPPFWRRGSLVS